MMLWKNRNKRVSVCVMVVTSCLVMAAVWAILATPGTALAKKPGGTGNDSVCFDFGDDLGDGVQSDGQGPYCNDKPSKVEAIMTSDGHANLQPNTGRGEGRTLLVDMDIVDDDPDVGVISCEAWRFLVGGWNDNFDMRTMGVGDTCPDVNLRICMDAPDGNTWRLMFNPDSESWIDPAYYEDSTFINVTRTTTDTWEVEVDASDRAVLVIMTMVKNKAKFSYGGVVTVPPFTATITLN